MVKFSIVVPTYNRAHLIEATLKSLLNQTYNNFEIIVVDDGSTDNTADVVKSITDKRLTYYLKDNAERAAARNFGAEKAIGDYINFFDSDDLAYENHLQTAANFLEQNNFSWFHLGYDIKTPEQDFVSRHPLKHSNPNQELIKGNYLSCNGVFVKKEILKTNKFNEDRALSASEDYELWMRLAAQFPLGLDGNITTTIVDHDHRSVRSPKIEPIIVRKELMLKYLFEDEGFVSKYGRYKNKMTANAFSYIALHAALAKNKKLGRKYYWKAFKQNPSSLFSKRMLAILKRLIF